MTVDELQPDPHEGLEAQIAQWRRYVQRREAISAADVTCRRSIAGDVGSSEVVTSVTAAPSWAASSASAWPCLPVERLPR